jgi:hypothetical protein
MDAGVLPLSTRGGGRLRVKTGVCRPAPGGAPPPRSVGSPSRAWLRARGAGGQGGRPAGALACPLKNPETARGARRASRGSLPRRSGLALSAAAGTAAVPFAVRKTASRDHTSLTQLSFAARTCVSAGGGARGQNARARPGPAAHGPHSLEERTCAAMTWRGCAHRPDGTNHRSWPPDQDAQRSRTRRPPASANWLPRVESGGKTPPASGTALGGVIAPSARGPAVWDVANAPSARGASS